MKAEQMTDREYFAMKGQSARAMADWAELDIDGDGAQIEFDCTDEFDCDEILEEEDKRLEEMARKFKEQWPEFDYQQA